MNTDTSPPEPPTGDLSASDRAKRAAAEHAATMVESGMRVGLGTGSTAAWLVRALGRRAREDGLRIRTVATSSQTAEKARGEGLAVEELDTLGWLDLTIDGADEIDPSLALIKGGGGALLQEKIVAAASDRMVVIADPGKTVARLGAFPLPVEVVRFGSAVTAGIIGEALYASDVDGSEVTLRQVGETPFVTDEGHFILDLKLGRIGDAYRLSHMLTALPGVVETGLFLDLCDTAVIGHADGRVEVRDATGGAPEAALAAGVADNLFTDPAD